MLRIINTDPRSVQVVCDRAAGRAVRLAGISEAERRNESARLAAVPHPLFALDDYREAPVLLRGASPPLPPPRPPPREGRDPHLRRIRRIGL